MTKKEWTILAIGVGVAVGAGITFGIFSRGVSGGRRRAVRAALKEYKFWNKGKTKESDSSVRARLSRYWENAGAPDYGYAQPWSAAWISHVMEQAGMGDRFPKSPTHHTYIRQAVKSRGDRNAPFVAYTPKEYAPRLGDLVCYARQSGIDFFSDRSFKSHCDIVVDKTKGITTVIGGNVSNTVKATDYQTDRKGRILNDKVKWIIKNNA